MTRGDTCTMRGTAFCGGGAWVTAGADCVGTKSTLPAQILVGSVMPLARFKSSRLTRCCKAMP